MTSQIADSVVFQGDRYELIGIFGGVLAYPEQFGMKPMMTQTNCYRGFYATYELTDKSLFLRELSICVNNGNYKPIGGVMPVKDKVPRKTYVYHGLNEIMTFSGRIRLAKNFFSEFYIHMGYQKASAYETVLDITLTDGQVVQIKDRSQEMEMKRGAFKKHYESGGIDRTTAEAFSLDMDLL
jgi:hypothetical protein